MKMKQNVLKMAIASALLATSAGVSAGYYNFENGLFNSNNEAPFTATNGNIWIDGFTGWELVPYEPQLFSSMVPLYHHQYLASDPTETRLDYNRPVTIVLDFWVLPADTLDPEANKNREILTTSYGDPRADGFTLMALYDDDSDAMRLKLYVGDGQGVWYGNETTGYSFDLGDMLADHAGSRATVELKFELGGDQPKITSQVTTAPASTNIASTPVSTEHSIDDPAKGDVAQMIAFLSGEPSHFTPSSHLGGQFFIGGSPGPSRHDNSVTPVYINQFNYDYTEDYDSTTGFEREFLNSFTAYDGNEQIMVDDVLVDSPFTPGVTPDASLILGSQQYLVSPDDALTHFDFNDKVTIKARFKYDSIISSEAGAPFQREVITTSTGAVNDEGFTLAVVPNIDGELWSDNGEGPDTPWRGDWLLQLRVGDGASLVDLPLLNYQRVEIDEWYDPYKISDVVIDFDLGDEVPKIALTYSSTENLYGQFDATDTRILYLDNPEIFDVSALINFLSGKIYVGGTELPTTLNSNDSTLLVQDISINYAEDRDGDGVSDDVDDFPNDPSEWNNWDGDYFGDNSDVTPWYHWDPVIQAEDFNLTEEYRLDRLILVDDGELGVAFHANTSPMTYNFFVPHTGMYIGFYHIQPTEESGALTISFNGVVVDTVGTTLETLETVPGNPSGFWLEGGHHSVEIQAANYSGPVNVDWFQFERMSD